MAGNFLQQENVVLTGACEAIVVDVQCIFPALGPLSKCFHTKFITTSPIAQMPDSDFILFEAETAGENAKKIVRAAVENFANRKKELVHIPQLKQKATVGYSVEAIIKTLDRSRKLPDRRDRYHQAFGGLHHLRSYQGRRGHGRLQQSEGTPGFCPYRADEKIN